MLPVPIIGARPDQIMVPFRVRLVPRGSVTCGGSHGGGGGRSRKAHVWCSKQSLGCERHHHPWCSPAWREVAFVSARARETLAFGRDASA